MDPSVTYTLFNQAYSDEDWFQALEYGEALDKWIRSRGFAPWGFSLDEQSVFEANLEAVKWYAHQANIEEEHDRYMSEMYTSR